MPRYNIETVKQAAASRWPEIFAAISGVSSDVLDGQHHPCPKCGGTDRFRLIDPEAGACLCNQCFTTKNGDGLAVVQWLTGDDFAAALEKIATHLGVKPEKGKKKLDPTEHLDFLPWNPVLVALWCRKKPPITPDSIQQIGGRVAKYRGQYTVIALPVLGVDLDPEKPNGWVIMRLDGKSLPVFKNRTVVDQVKIKTMPGTKRGVIGFFPKKGSGVDDL